jgi:hypothetical protein
MARITWDEIGERIFEAGVFNCVLYNEERQGTAWNGITSIKESVSSDAVDELYFDGKKIAPYIGEEDFSGTITAVTYPDSFLDFTGESELYPGINYSAQSPKKFHLSYKTNVGNYVDGIDHGYKIHILYNLTAKPSSIDNSTNNESISILDFSWEINSLPEIVEHHRPTAHIIIDASTINEDVLDYIENALYGTETSDPELPLLSEFVKNINEWGLIIITDNMDGTWTATGPDEYFSMIDSTTFQITGVDGTYSDADTYTISSTTPT